MARTGVAITADPVTASTTEDTPVDVTLTGTDGGGTCPLTVAVATPPAHGSLGPVGSPTCTAGAVSATVTYTPDPDYAGSDQFTFTVSDPGVHTSDPSPVSLTVDPVQDPPSALDLTTTTSEDTPVDVTLQGHDPDGDCPLAVALATGPAHGTVDPPGAPQCLAGDMTVTTVYRPAAHYAGPDSFTFTVTDPSGATSSPGTVTVSVSAVDDPPVASDVSISATPGATATWVPQVSDPDSPSLTCAVATAPTPGHGHRRRRLQRRHVHPGGERPRQRRGDLLGQRRHQRGDGPAAGHPPATAPRVRGRVRDR